MLKFAPVFVHNISDSGLGIAVFYWSVILYYKFGCQLPLLLSGYFTKQGAKAVYLTSPSQCFVLAWLGFHGQTN